MSVAPTVEQRMQFGKHAGNRTKQINTTINPSGNTQQHTHPDGRGIAGKVEWEEDERGGRGEGAERKTPKRSAWHVPLSLFPRRRRRRNLIYFLSVSKKCKVGFGSGGRSRRESGSKRCCEGGAQKGEGEQHRSIIRLLFLEKGDGGATVFDLPMSI